MKNFLIRSVFVLAIYLPAGCGSSPWASMTTIAPSGNSPEAVFAEMKQAAFDRDLAKFYGCLTVKAREEQIETMMRDLAGLGHIAPDQTDRSEVILPDMPASTQTCLVVINKYHLSKRWKIDEVPAAQFGEFVPDLWHAMQSKEIPYIEENAILKNVIVTGETAIGTIENAHNRHNHEFVQIYFEKSNGQWLVDVSPWWAPWGPPPQRLNRQWEER